MPSKTIPRRCPLDLLRYEIVMLNNLYWLMNKRAVNYTPNEQRTNEVAQLEAFLVHARNIMDFLATGGASWKLKDTEGNSPKVIVNLKDNEMKKNINKHLQHLLPERANKRIEWDTHDIISSINEGLRKFFDKISPEYFPTTNGRKIEDFYNLIKPINKNLDRSFKTTETNMDFLKTL